MTISNNQSVHIDHIFVEIVWDIASYLKFDEALNWSQTSRHFKEILFSEDFFKYRLIQNFPLLKTIPSTFVIPFESQIPNFWQSASICLDNGLISTSPLSLKIAASSLKCLPPIFDKMPYKGKSIYLISQNFESINWGNAVRYFAHILKTFQTKLELVSDLENFKLKKEQYKTANDELLKAETLNELYKIKEKYNPNNTSVINTKNLNTVSYLMDLEEFQINWSLAMIYKRQASLLHTSDPEINVEKTLMQDWRKSMPNLIPTENFFKENEKTIVP